MNTKEIYFKLPADGTNNILKSEQRPHSQQQIVKFMNAVAADERDSDRLGPRVDINDINMVEVELPDQLLHF